MIWQCIGVFAAMFAVDFVWAVWTYAITARKALLSSNYSAILILLSGFAAVGYVSNPWLLIPAMTGAWAGTFLSVYLAKRKDDALVR
jgi:uncharacterized membrane protein YfcA